MSNVVFDASRQWSTCPKGVKRGFKKILEPVEQILLNETVIAALVCPIEEIRSRYLWCLAGQIWHLESSCWDLEWLNILGGI